MANNGTKSHKSLNVLLCVHTDEQPADRDQSLDFNSLELINMNILYPIPTRNDSFQECDHCVS